MSESTYQPEKGTEDYVHVHVTEKQGQPVPEGTFEQYHPNAWPAVSKLPGYKADVVHDPRTAAQKTAAAPLASEVKSTEQLTEVEQYRERYQQLFKEDAPFNITLGDLKVIVDRANAKLAELQGGEKAVTEEEKQKAAGEQSGEGEGNREGEPEQLPTLKADWFALYQKTFPEATEAEGDITIAQIREKLSK